MKNAQRVKVMPELSHSVNVGGLQAEDIYYYCTIWSYYCKPAVLCTIFKEEYTSYKLKSHRGAAAGNSVS